MEKLRESGGDLIDSYDKIRIEAECQLDIRMKIFRRSLYDEIYAHNLE